MMGYRRSDDGIRWCRRLAVLGMSLLLGLAGCDMIIPPENATTYDNPLDPHSPAYVEPQTTILSGPAGGSIISSSTPVLNTGSNCISIMICSRTCNKSSFTSFS